MKLFWGRKKRFLAWLCLVAVFTTNSSLGNVAYGATDDGRPRRIKTGQCSHSCLDEWECMDLIEPWEIHAVEGIATSSDADFAGNEDAAFATAGNATWANAQISTSSDGDSEKIVIRSDNREDGKKRKKGKYDPETGNYVGPSCVHEHDDECGYYAYRSKFTYSDKNVTVKATMVAPTEFALPEGSVLQAEQIVGEDRLEEIAEVLNDQDGSAELKPNDFYAYDVYFECDGEETEPEDASVTVSMSYKKALEISESSDDALRVLHINNDMEVTDVTKSITKNANGEIAKVEFETDTCSVFVLTAASIPNTFTYEDEEKKITAVVPGECEIPAGSRLVVEEYDPDSEEYQLLGEKLTELSLSKGVSLSGYVLYDIRFETEGEELEPAAGLVSVAVEYKHGKEILSEEVTAGQGQVRVIHFEEQDGEQIPVDVTVESSLQEEYGVVRRAGFQTGSFSPVAVIYETPSVMDTIFTHGGDYSFEYIAGNFNAFVSESFGGTHVVGPLAVGGEILPREYGGKLSIGSEGMANAKPWGRPYYIHTTPSYFKGAISSHISDIETNVEPDMPMYLGMKNAPGGKPGSISHVQLAYTDDYIDFDEAMESLSLEADSFKGEYRISKETIQNYYNKYKNSNNFKDLSLFDGMVTLSMTYALDQHHNGKQVVVTVEGGHSYELETYESVGMVSIRNYGEEPTIVKLNGDRADHRFPHVTALGNGNWWNLNGCNFVWILPDAERLNLCSTNFSGHILAPKADVKQDGGNFDGSIIAKSIQSKAEFHMWPFHGSIEGSGGEGETEVSFRAVKTVDGETPKEEETFTFSLDQLVDGVWKNLQEVKNDEKGSVAFSSLSYPAAEAGNTYWYRISEKQVESDRYLMDQTQYLAEVEIITGETGIPDNRVTYYQVPDKELTNIEGGIVVKERLTEIEKNQLAFENLTRMSGSVTVRKDLMVNGIINNQYDTTTTFYITLFEDAAGLIPVRDSEMNQRMTKPVKAGENVTFYGLELGERGREKRYYLFETDQYGNRLTGVYAGYLVPDTGKEVVLSRTDYEKSEVIVNSKTDVSGTIGLKAIKIFDQGEIAKQSFDFTLFEKSYDSNGKEQWIEKETVSSDPSGQVIFSEIMYQVTDAKDDLSGMHSGVEGAYRYKDYTYKITEQIPEDAAELIKDNIRYDDTEYQVTVRVSETAVPDQLEARILKIEADGISQNAALPITFTNQKISGWASINKRFEHQDAMGSEELSDLLKQVRVSVYTKADNKAVPGFEDLIPDEQGVVTAGPLAYGEYYFKETAGPDSYLLNQNHYEFRISEHLPEDKPVQAGTMINTKVDAGVSFQKVDADQPGKPLSNVRFELYKETMEGDLKLGVYSSNEEGFVEGKSLGEGTYYFTEQPYPGYEVDTELRYYFSITAADHGTMVNLHKGSPAGEVITKIENRRKKGAVITKKVDEERQGLEGAEFTLYAKKSDPDNFFGKLHVALSKKTGQELGYEMVGDGPFRTGEDGVLSINELPWNEYKLVETKAPDGYDLVSREYLFTIDAEHLNVTIGNEYGEIINQGQTGSLRLVKTDESETATPLSGAEFDLFQVNPQIGEADIKIGSGYRTDETGKTPVIHNLKWGTYYFVETKAPVGYAINPKVSEQRITITKENVQVSKEIPFSITVRDQEFQVEVEKRDRDTGESLSGAKMELYRMEDIVAGKGKAGAVALDRWISEAGKPHAIGQFLEGGSDYVLVEQEAPAGYTVAKNTIFTMGADGQLSMIDGMVDGNLILIQDVKYTPGSLELKAGKILTGRTMKQGEFEFELRDLDGQIVSSAVNGADGSIRFDTMIYSLPGVYEYKLVERKGSLGGITYDGTEYPIHVSVTENEEGVLTAEASYGADVDGIIFKNSYHSVGNLDVEGTKRISGRQFQDGDEFTFELLRNGYVVDSAVIRPAAGTTEHRFRLSDRTITQAMAGKTYDYEVRELYGGQTIRGVTYDHMVYQGRYQAIDQGDGSVKMEKLSGADLNQVEFTNHYQSGQAKFTITGNKYLSGRDFMEGDHFTFTAEKNGEPFGEVTIYPSDGNEMEFQFAPDSYTTEDVNKTYHYVIREMAGSISGMTYSDRSYTVKVTVKEDGEGNLNVSAVLENEPFTNVTFTNYWTEQNQGNQNNQGGNGGNNWNSGNGGNGGSHNGGFSGNSSSSGGPGAVDEDQIFIDDGDVPLAGLPGDPQTGISNQVTILDEEVPLAGLPKMGDKDYVALKWMMMLSFGAFMKLLVKKRQEDQKRSGNS